MKNREKVAIIVVIIILLLVFTILTINYLKYSSCSGADAVTKPGCVAASADGNGSAKPALRLSLGNGYVVSEP